MLGYRYFNFSNCNIYILDNYIFSLNKTTVACLPDVHCYSGSLSSGQNVRNKTFNLTVILKSYSETQLTFLLVNDIPGAVMARSSLIGLENAHFEFIFFPDWSR